MMETIQAFLKVSSWPTRADFKTLPIVHGLFFLGVNVFAIECIQLRLNLVSKQCPQGVVRQISRDGHDRKIFFGFKFLIP